MKGLLWKWLAFVALMSGAVLLANDWRRADHWLFAALFMPGQDQPDASILLLELPDVGSDDPSAKAFRELLGRTLQELARRGAKDVAVDVAVIEGGAGLPEVVAGISALLAQRANVFFGVHPELDASQPLAAAIYRDAGVTGVGHTELHRGQGLVLFRSVATQAATGKQYPYLPALLAGVDPWSLPEHQVVRVPRNKTRPLHVDVRADGTWDAAAQRMSERKVIVSSWARECRQGGGGLDGRPCDAAGAWTGPELLVWSLSQLLRGGDAARQPVSDPLSVLTGALGVAGLGLLLHVSGVRLAARQWSPTLLQRRLWIVDGTVLLALLVLLALAELLLVRLGWIMPPTFLVIAALVTLGLCHAHSRTHLAGMLADLTRRAADDALRSEVDVFISYSHAPDNAAWVERSIVEPLRALMLPDGRRLRLFFDKGSITVGQDWFRRINLSILGSRAFLCVWSDDYLERDYCRWELDYAFPRAARRDFLFLPVARLSAGAQPGPAYAQYLQARQYVDASSRADFIDELIAALRAHLAAPRSLP
ncbi:toll/interleukin-1 receptor domain-containing protein [Piscinibacter sp.]|uniref:toll/interleukin-1 receptor domain-containing protein n=1 Tax=Piscinibacter sp. TaxID=1903157 RepID=UPI002F3FE65B